jgi:hypothetical protein
LLHRLDAFFLAAAATRTQGHRGQRSQHRASLVINHALPLDIDLLEALNFADEIPPVL